MTLGRFGLRRREYDFPPFRPPSEANSLLLRVTRDVRGTDAPSVRCTKGRSSRSGRRRGPGRYRTARDLYGDRVRTVFIGDSNSLVVKTEMLVKILNALLSSFPHIERVTSYARAKTVAKKPLEDLTRIRQAGLDRLHVGLETGDRTSSRRSRRSDSGRDDRGREKSERGRV